MIRWFQSREMQKTEAALRYAESVIKTQEQKIAVLQDEKTALRASMLHWRHLYHEVAMVIPPEKPG